MSVRPMSVRPKMFFAAALSLMLALSLVPGSATLADSSKATQTSPCSGSSDGVVSCADARLPWSEEAGVPIATSLVK